MSTGILSTDSILTFILSETMMVIVALAFVGCIIALVKLRRKPCTLRRVCMVLAVLFALYLIAIGILVFAFDSSKPPAAPAPAMP